MKHAFNRLGFQIGFGVTLLLCGLAAALFFVLFNQSKTALVDAAETRQAMSIKILVNEMAHYQDFEVTTDANGEVSGLTAQSIVAFENHDMIDRVGSISGETATIFVWDDAEQDFVRRTTNIIKDDGARAVGTVLGKANPVYASMMKGEVFRGQATILGKDYFTIYVPVLSEAGRAAWYLLCRCRKGSADSCDQRDVGRGGRDCCPRSSGGDGTNSDRASVYVASDPIARGGGDRDPG